MERIAVRSTEIALVGYEDKSSTLEITFRRGGVYHYFDVTPEIYKNLVDSPSLGTYFSTEIKDKFRYQKIC